MELSLTTPALLFPALSLLLLAYTNRFLSLSAVIRNLYDRHREKPDPRHLRQLDNLRRRVELIRQMQTAGTLSILLTSVSMTFLFFGLHLAGLIAFGISLVLMCLSLALSVMELAISGDALTILLADLEQISGEDKPKPRRWLRRP
ncbi:MAG: DUF2721 domain-containing protein [Microvirgula sp.]